MRQMQILIANRELKLETLIEELGEELKELKGIATLVGRPKAPTHQEPWELPESKLPPKEHTWAIP